MSHDYSSSRIDGSLRVFFFFFLLIIDDDNDFLFLFSRYFSKRSVVAFIQDYSLQFGDLIRFCFYIGFS